MRLNMIDDNTMEGIKKQVDSFVERNASLLVRKSPDEIIKMWLDWQFSRYMVDEQEDGFFVNDVETKTIVAYVSKSDPLAYHHAHQIREDLNNEIDGSIELLVQGPTIKDILDNLDKEGDDE